MAHEAPYKWQPMAPDTRLGAWLLALAVLLTGVTLLSWGHWEMAVAGVLALAAAMAGSVKLREPGGVRRLDAVLQEPPAPPWPSCQVPGCWCREETGIAG